MYLEDGSFVFDKDNCENCYQEVLAWDGEIHYNEVLKQYGKKYNHIEFMDLYYSKNAKCWIASPNKRLCKDPVKKRYFKRRKDGKITSSHFYKKENYHHTRAIKRSFRRKMKQKLYNEEYYNPRPRDYHTYGWLTW